MSAGVIGQAIQILDDANDTLSSLSLLQSTQDVDVEEDYAPPSFNDYDAIVQSFLHRKLQLEDFHQVEDGRNVSSTMSYIEDSARKAQALVNLDFFSDRFQADNSVKSLTEVSAWIDQTARNHSTFLHQIDISDDIRHFSLNDDSTEGGDSVRTFDRLRKEYIGMSNRKLQGLLRQCAQARQMWCEEIRVRVHTSKRDQRELWETTVNRIRAADVLIKAASVKHEELDRDIWKAKITDKAIRKIVEDRFKATFKQIQTYCVLQDQRLKEVNTDIKKYTRDRDKLQKMLEELRSNRLTSDVTVCNRAKYLVSSIAKDLKIKEKKTGLSLTAKLEENLEMIEKLRVERSDSVEKSAALLEQENSTQNDLSLMIERVPRLRVAARIHTKALQDQSKRLADRVMKLECITAECGYIAQRKHESRIKLTQPQANKPVEFTKSPFVHIGRLINEIDAPNRVAGKLKATKRRMANFEEEDEENIFEIVDTESLVESVLVWKEQKMKGAADESAVNSVRRRASQIHLLSKRFDGGLDNVVSAGDLAARATADDISTSAILCGCYAVHAIVYQKKKAALLKVKEEAMRRRATVYSADIMSPLQRMSSARSKRGTSFKIDVSAFTKVPAEPESPLVESVSYDVAEMAHVLSHAVTVLTKIECCPINPSVKCQNAIKCLSRELKVKGLVAQPELILSEIILEIIHNLFSKAPVTLLVKNKKRVFSTCMAYLFAIVNIYVIISPEKLIKHSGLVSEEVSEVVEEASLRLLVVLAGDAGTAGGSKTVRVVKGIMNDICSAIEAGCNACGIVRVLSLSELLHLLFNAVKCLPSSRDQPLPSVEVLDRLAKKQQLDGQEQKCFSEEEPFSMVDRHTILAAQIFLACVTNPEISRISALELLLDGAQSGLRANHERSGTANLRPDQSDDCLFPLHLDFDSCLSLVPPPLLPGFLGLDLLRRIIEKEVARTGFLQRISEEDSSIVDLRYLGVSLQTDVQLAVSENKAATTFNTSRRQALKDVAHSVLQTRPDKEDSPQLNEGLTVMPIKMTVIEGPPDDSEVDLVNDEWIDSLSTYLGNICEELTNMLWGPTELSPVRDEEELDSIIVPIHDDLKQRIFVLTEAFRRITSSRSSTSKSELTILMSECEACIQQVVRARSTFVNATNVLVEPWQKKSEWLKRQLENLTSENADEAEDIRRLQEIVATVEEDKARIDSELMTCRKKLKISKLKAGLRDERLNVRDHPTRSSPLAVAQNTDMQELQHMENILDVKKKELAEKQAFFDRLVSVEKIRRATAASRSLTQSQFKATSTSTTQMSPLLITSDITMSVPQSSSVPTAPQQSNASAQFSTTQESILHSPMTNIHSSKQHVVDATPTLPTGHSQSASNLMQCLPASIGSAQTLKHVELNTLTLHLGSTDSSFNTGVPSMNDLSQDSTSSESNQLALTLVSNVHPASTAAHSAPHFIDDVRDAGGVNVRDAGGVNVESGPSEQSHDTYGLTNKPNNRPDSSDCVIPRDAHVSTVTPAMDEVDQTDASLYDDIDSNVEDIVDDIIDDSANAMADLRLLSRERSFFSFLGDPKFKMFRDCVPENHLEDVMIIRSFRGLSQRGGEVGMSPSRHAERKHDNDSAVVPDHVAADPEAGMGVESLLMSKPIDVPQILAKEKSTAFPVIDKRTVCKGVKRGESPAAKAPPVLLVVRGVNSRVEDLHSAKTAVSSGAAGEHVSVSLQIEASDSTLLGHDLNGKSEEGTQNPEMETFENDLGSHVIGDETPLADLDYGVNLDYDKYLAATGEVVDVPDRELSEAEFFPRLPVVRITSGASSQVTKSTQSLHEEMNAANMSGMVQTELLKKYKQALALLPSRNLTVNENTRQQVLGDIFSLRKLKFDASRYSSSQQVAGCDSDAMQQLSSLAADSMSISSESVLTPSQPPSQPSSALTPSQPPSARTKKSPRNRIRLLD